MPDQLPMRSTPAARPRQGGDDTPDAPPAPDYSFDGYTVEVSQKIALTPITRHRHRHDKPNGANRPAQ